MNQEKSEILASLYSVRAGISAISLEKAKLDAQASVLDKSRAQEKDLRSKETILSAELEKLQADLRQQEKTSEKKAEKNCWTLTVLIPSFLSSLLGFLAPVLIYIVAWIVEFFHQIGSNEYTALYNFAFINGGMRRWWYIFVLSLAAAIFVIAFITLSVINRKENRKYFSELQSQEAKIRLERETTANSINDKKAKAKKVACEITRTQAQVSAAQTELILLKNIAAQMSATFYASLVQAFKNVLDPRDWQNIDLVIFYYETGRAESMKEALQQVDRQRQNENLIKAVRDASSQISMTISHSIDGLRAEMKQCFGSLSQQLAHQHDDYMQKLDAIRTENIAFGESVKDMSQKLNANLQSADKHLGALCEESYLTEALMRKIDTDSLTLMRDVEYMTNLKRAS